MLLSVCVADGKYGEREKSEGEGEMGEEKEEDVVDKIIIFPYQELSKISLERTFSRQSQQHHLAKNAHTKRAYKPCRTPCKMSKLETPPNSLVSFKKHAPVDAGL